MLEKRFNKDFTWAYEKKQRDVGILIKVVRNEISKTHKKKTEKKNRRRNNQRYWNLI